MIVFDTDHITVFKYRSGARYGALIRRLEESGESPASTIITVEEYMRGWLAVIAKERKAARQVNAYRELGNIFDLFNGFSILPFDDAAAVSFDQLRSARLGVGSRDLKIAAITLIFDATLLTANRRDFEKVPGLRFENWLD